MRFKISTNLHWFRSFSWYRLLLVSLGLLPLLLVSVPAAVATSTPVIITPSPGATATPFSLYETNIVLDFKDDRQFFIESVGDWIGGEGFVTVSQELLFEGNGNEYGPITQVSLNYSVISAGGAAFVTLAAQYNGLTIHSAGATLNQCTACGNFVVPLDGATIDNFVIHVEAGSGVFVQIHSMTIRTGTGSLPTPTYATVDGCPVLSSYEVSLLDPRYVASCSRCFAQPTRRVAPIPTGVMSTPSSGTSEFTIPVMVSGTPMTKTPYGIPLPAATLAPGTPSATPSATATPDNEVVVYNFLGSNTNSFVPSYDGGDFYGEITGSGWKSVHIDVNSGGSTINREYIQIALSGVNVTNITALSFHIAKDYETTIGFNIYLNHGGGLVRYLGRTYLGGSVTLDDLFLISPSAYYDQLFIDVYSGVGDTNPFYLQQISVETSNPAPPTSTPTITPTYESYFEGYKTPTEAVCGAPVWRDNDPIAQFPIGIDIQGYDCYSIIPEMYFNIPGQDEDFNLVGLDLCVTWFTWPTIGALGFNIGIDWILVMFLGFLLVRLYQF